MEIVKKYLLRLLACILLTLVLSMVILKTKHGDAYNKFVLKDAAAMHVQLLSGGTLSSTSFSEDSMNHNCSAQRSLVFVKTHKSGSTTLIAMLQKFAYLNHLRMMVPDVENNMFDWPLQFEPNVDNVRSEDGPFDMLVNHIVFNRSAIFGLMKPGTQYVTIMRDPLAHLRSSFQYFDVNAGDRLGKGVDAIKLFLSNPPKYDNVPEWMKAYLVLKSNRIFSITQNLQSADLGLSYADFNKPQKVDKFVNETVEDFQLILILERLEESVVVLRRLMCWKMQDIMFLSKNVNPNREFETSGLSLQNKMSAYRWSSSDTELYKAANRKLDALILREKDIDEEIAAYKTIREIISKFCWNENRTELVIPAGKWNEEFVVDSKFCVLLLIDERDLTHVFKCNQHGWHKDCTGASGSRYRVLKSVIEGRLPHRYLKVIGPVPAP